MKIKSLLFLIYFGISGEILTKDQGNCLENSSTYKKVHLIDQGVKGSEFQRTGIKQQAFPLNQCVFYFIFRVILSNNLGTTVLVSLTTTEHHRMGGLNNRYSFLTVLEMGSLRLGADMVGFWCGPSPWLADDLLLFVLIGQREGGL